MYKKKKGILGVVVTTIILIILVFLTNVNTEKLSYIENVCNSLIMPIQNGITYVKNKIKGNNSFFENISEIQEKNKQLQEENIKLEQSLRELEIIKAENTTLKEYLSLTEKYEDFKSIPAYIISKDVSNYSSVFVLNVGTDDGVENGMTVIADKGLVGHVISVTNSTAKVQTIIDSASNVSAKINTSNESISCKGVLSSKTLKATYIPNDAELISGDTVQTSGMGGIYPKGIHIGTVRKIVSTNNILDRYLEIEPAVDFETVETVLVITH